VGGGGGAPAAGAGAAGVGLRPPAGGGPAAAARWEKTSPRLVSPVICKDILDTPTREILRAAGLRAGQRPGLLIGGPPCTPFSKSGFWLEWKREGLDPGASLLQAYTRVLAEARPRRVVLEHVYALTYRN